MHLPKVIKENRVIRGYTQEALASEANISLRTIQRIEKGQVKPQLHTLKVLSDVLSIDLLCLHQQDNANKATSKDETVLFFNLFCAVIPPLNVVTLLWLRSTSNKYVVGSKFLFLQVLLFISFLLMTIVVPYITYFVSGQKMIGLINPLLIIYFSYLLTQVILTYSYTLNTNRS